MISIDMIDKLRARGWQIQLKEQPSLFLDASFFSRYGRQPPTSFLDFLTVTETFANATDTAWLMCESDYTRKGDGVYMWNDFERSSLRATSDMPTEAALIVDFWNKHLPIGMSVGGDQSYLALVMDTEMYGSIAYGIHPANEECWHVCKSFSELCDLISIGPQGNKDLWWLEDFV